MNSDADDDPRKLCRYAWSCALLPTCMGIGTMMGMLPRHSEFRWLDSSTNGFEFFALLTCITGTLIFPGGLLALFKHRRICARTDGSNRCRHLWSSFVIGGLLVTNFLVSVGILSLVSWQWRYVIGPTLEAMGS